LTPEEEVEIAREAPKLVIIDGEANAEPEVIKKEPEVIERPKPRYKLPNWVKKHHRDFVTLSSQHLSEAVRRFNNTRYGEGKQYWADRAEKLGGWHHRLNQDNN